MPDSLEEMFKKFVKWCNDNADDSLIKSNEPPVVSAKPKYIGARIRDNLIGTEGVCLAIMFHLHDCQWGLLQPIELKDGKPQRGHWMDTQRLEILDDKGRETKDIPIKLGYKVRDTISSFEGIVTNWTDELYGEPYLSLTAEHLHEGKPIHQDFQLSRLEIVEARSVPVSENSVAPRGAMGDPSEYKSRYERSDSED